MARTARMSLTDQRDAFTYTGTDLIQIRPGRVEQHRQQASGTHQG